MTSTKAQQDKATENFRRGVQDAAQSKSPRQAQWIAARERFWQRVWARYWRTAG